MSERCSKTLSGVHFIEWATAEGKRVGTCAWCSEQITKDPK